MFEFARPPKPDFSILPARLPTVQLSRLVHVGDMVGYDKSVPSTAGSGLPFTLSQATSAYFQVTGHTSHELRRIDGRAGTFLDVTKLLQNGDKGSFRAFAKTAGLLDENNTPTSTWHAIVSRSPETPPLFELGLAMAVLIASEARLDDNDAFDGIWCCANSGQTTFGILFPTRLHVWTSASSVPFDPTDAAMVSDVFDEQKNVSYGPVTRSRATSTLEIRRRNLGARFTALRLRMALNECRDPVMCELLEDALEKVQRLHRSTAHNIQFTFEPTGERVSVFAPDGRSLKLHAEHGHLIHENIARQISPSIIE